MKTNILCSLLIFSINFTGCNSRTFSNNKNHQNKKISKEKGEKMKKTIQEKALKIVKAFETGDHEILSIFHPEFKMHRPEYPSSKETMASFFPIIKDVVKMDNKRNFTDGDIVVTHNYSYNYPENPPYISIDILRFKDGMIIEYWDIMDIEVDKRKNENTQYDGSTEVIDLDKTDHNKTLVSNYKESVYIQKNIDAIDTYINNDKLIQHSPYLANGRKALKDYLKTPATEYKKLKKVLGQGNFVLTICDGLLDGMDAAFFDIYRVENDLIVEHWEVKEILPPKEKWQNENGKTNFDY